MITQDRILQTAFSARSPRHTCNHRVNKKHEQRRVVQPQRLGTLPLFSRLVIPFSVPERFGGQQPRTTYKETGSENGSHKSSVEVHFPDFQARRTREGHNVQVYRLKHVLLNEFDGRGPFAACHEHHRQRLPRIHHRPKPPLVALAAQVEKEAQSREPQKRR